MLAAVSRLAPDRVVGSTMLYRGSYSKQRAHECFCWCYCYTTIDRGGACQTTTSKSGSNIQVSSTTLLLNIKNAIPGQRQYVASISCTRAALRQASHFRASGICIQHLLRKITHTNYDKPRADPTPSPTFRDHLRHSHESFPRRCKVTGTHTPSTTLNDQE
jgi:hypothetical protein